MQPMVGTAITRDGLTLRTVRWRPDGMSWASLLLVHGLGEHAGRYDHVARQLAAAGIDVHGYDHRGFGASGGPRAYVHRWSDLHDDLEARAAAAREATTGVPLVMYGHSMGGLVAIGYVLDRRPLPDLLVLSAPGLASTIAAWKRRVAPVLGRVTPHARIPNGFAPNALSRDPAVDARVAADPLCQSTTTARLGAEGFAELHRVARALAGGARLPLPTYVLHGEADPVVPVAASAVLEGDPAVTRRVYPGLRHECHNEPEGPSVVADTIAWLRAALPARPDRQPAAVGASSLPSSSR